MGGDYLVGQVHSALQRPISYFAAEGQPEATADEAPIEYFFNEAAMREGYEATSNSASVPQPSMGTVPTATGQNGKRLWGILRRHVLRKSKARQQIKFLVESFAQLGYGTGKLRGNKAIDQGYWLEKLDAKHRLGSLLVEFYAIWKSSPSAVSFFDWLDEGKWEAYLSIRKSPLEFQLAKKGVTYLTELGRESYRLEVRKGLLYQNGSPFDTRTMKSAWGGQGVAIFVQSRENRFYAGEYQYAQVHHSSFLAGDPVRSAGELIVWDGRLKAVSIESGHYKPDPKRLPFALEGLRDQLVAMNGVKVRVFKKDAKTGKPWMNLDSGLMDELTKSPVRQYGGIPVYVDWRQYLFDAALRDQYSVFGLSAQV